MSSTKLSVTLNERLVGKYEDAGLRQIGGVIDKWIAADSARGIKTIHLALDDAKAMSKLGVAPIPGTASAAAVKRAIDALWAKLSPDYLVIVGGPDVVPYFEVPNPSYDGTSGDRDAVVSTDNPYACSKPFSSKDRLSYLVPDRVVGRIVDLPSEGDTALLVQALTTATAWQSRDKVEDDYAVCCDEWRGAGAECGKVVGGVKTLLLSPPEKDGAPLSLAQLGARFHLIKCHGAQLNPNFYGQKGGSYPTALFSGTLDGLVTPGTVVGAMCCYGAQVFSPNDPAVTPNGAWPIAATYLRRGAYGFFGSTKIAWVGRTSPMCADWLVSQWLKAVRSGASVGCAALEAKQQYVTTYVKQQQQRGAPDLADEKTLLEYVLLGDPSIHPVLPEQAVAGAIASMAVSTTVLAERRQRRIEAQADAVRIRSFLPKRSAAPRQALERSDELFASVVRGLFEEEPEALGLSSKNVRVQKVTTALSRGADMAGVPRTGARASTGPSRRESLQYYWSGRSSVQVDGVTHTKIRLVRVETDPDGNVLSRAAVESA